MKFPEKSLMPSNHLKDQYHFNYWMSFLTGDWHPTFWPLYNWEHFTTEQAPQTQSCIKTAALIRIKALTAVIDKHLQTNTYMTENRLTLLDPYAYAIARQYCNNSNLTSKYYQLG
jgi:glutathione S-transferase